MAESLHWTCYDRVFCLFSLYSAQQICAHAMETVALLCMLMTRISRQVKANDVSFVRSAEELVDVRDSRALIKLCKFKYYILEQLLCFMPHDNL